MRLSRKGIGRVRSGSKDFYILTRAEPTDKSRVIRAPAPLQCHAWPLGIAENVLLGGKRSQVSLNFDNRSVNSLSNTK